MRRLRALWMRLGGLVRRRDDEDFTAELESHVAMDTEGGIHEGLDAAEARRRALVRLGGMEQTRQAYRDRRGLPWLESLARDFSYSVRTLRKHRGITAIAVLSIGLGIGANATIFSMVSRFIVRPAPVGDPSTLIALHILHDGDRCCNNFPFPVYADVRDQAQSLAGVAAYDPLIPASIGGSGEPERVWGQGVTSNFFDVTGIRMAVGRGFINGDENAPEVVLGAGLWQRRFNSDVEIAGKPVMISGRTFTVAGVAPAAFHSIDQILNSEFWVPLGNAARLATGVPPLTSRDHHWLEVVGRVRPGVTRAQVTAELNTLSQRFVQSYPATDNGSRIIFDQAGSMPPKQRSAVLIFLAALSAVVLMVLFMAGANVAALLFAQASGRQREMAVRLALGATRGRIRRQMLMESALLGLGGGVLGVLLSLWATRALSALHLPTPVPINLSIDVDWRVLLFTFSLSVLSGLLLGMAPAWAASHPRLAHALKGEDVLVRPGRRLSLRNLLVVAQIAMSLVLLCMTGLFLRSLQSAAGIDIGFSPQHLLVMSVDPRVHGYSAERTEQFLVQLKQSVTALPGVNSAVWTDVAPLSGGDRSDSFRAEGPLGKGKAGINVALFMVTPGYFDTMGIPRTVGRDFGSETATGPKTAIVNRAFVERVFGGANPIGQHVSGGGISYEIIGVAGNVKARTLGEETRPVLYRSLRQSIAGDPSQMGYTLVVRAAGNPSAFMEPVRRQIHLLDPAMAVYNAETMTEHVRTAYFLPHLAAALFGTFGCIGLVLATVGLYGVMSYAVSRRTREIGIRMALGAQPGTVERLVLRQGMVLTLIAMALGWPVAWMLARLAASSLYGIHPHDAITFAFVPPFLLAIALAACWFPARRAASIDPMQALRTE
jgi:putative ABC transport system permease protein